MSSIDGLKKSMYLILGLGLLFAFSSISIYFVGYVLSDNDDSIEIPSELNSGPPKASGTWLLDNITIDPTETTPGSLT